MSDKITATKTELARAFAILAHEAFEREGKIETLKLVARTDIKAYSLFRASEFMDVIRIIQSGKNSK